MIHVSTYIYIYTYFLTGCIEGVGLMTWSPLTMGFSASKGEESFPNFHRMSFKVRMKLLENCSTASFFECCIFFFFFCNGQKKFSTVTWPEAEEVTPPATSKEVTIIN